MAPHSTPTLAGGGPVTVRVCCPEEGEIVFGKGKFFVYGFVRPLHARNDLIARATVQLYGGNKKVLYGKPVDHLPFPFDWGVRFDGAPTGAVKLVVRAADEYGNIGEDVRHFGYVVGLAAVAPAAAAAPRGPTIVVSYPQASPPAPPVPTSFQAYGYVPSPHPITAKDAWLEAGGTRVIDGTFASMAHYGWSFSFEDLAPGQVYVLKIQMTDQTGTTTDVRTITAAS